MHCQKCTFLKKSKNQGQNKKMQFRHIWSCFREARNPYFYSVLMAPKKGGSIKLFLGDGQGVQLSTRQHIYIYICIMKCSCKLMPDHSSGPERIDFLAGCFSSLRLVEAKRRLLQRILWRLPTKTFPYLFCTFFMGCETDLEATASDQSPATIIMSGWALLGLATHVIFRKGKVVNRAGSWMHHLIHVSFTCRLGRELPKHWLLVGRQFRLNRTHQKYSVLFLILLGLLFVTPIYLASCEWAKCYLPPPSWFWCWVQWILLQLLEARH